MRSDIFDLMQNPTFRGLLANIHEEPANDDLRLILADWLEERGDDWAELIRYQITSREHGIRVRERLITASRLGELCTRLEQDLNHWTGAADLGGMSYQGASHRLRFHRGFLQSISISLLDWYQYGKRICELHPVHGVTVTDSVAWRHRASDGTLRFYWLQEHAGSAFKKSIVPEPIFRLLLGIAQRPWASSILEAQANLEKACLLFARNSEV